MALKIDINFNELLDRVTIGDYLLHKDSGKLYRVIKHRNIIYTLDVQNAEIEDVFGSFTDFLASDFMKKENLLVIKESNFKLIMKPQ